MTLITTLKRDTSLNIVVQKFDSVEDLTLRINAREMTNERQSPTDNLKLRWTVWALLKSSVSSNAKVALSSRRSDAISPLFQSVFFVHGFHSCDEILQTFSGCHTFQLQLCCTVTDKAVAAVLAQDRVHVS